VRLTRGVRRPFADQNRQRDLNPQHPRRQEHEPNSTHPRRSASVCRWMARSGGKTSTAKGWRAAARAAARERERSGALRLEVDAELWPIVLQREDKARAAAERERALTAEEVEVLLQEDFLDAIRVYAPQVLDDLAAVSDRAGITRWAERWHLGAPWAGPLATATLERWNTRESDPARNLDRQRAQQAREWNLEREPHTAERPPRTRPKSVGTKQRTAPWVAGALVRFQILGEAWHKVAPNRARRDLLRSVAKAIELRLRETPTGRPPTP